ncbi:MAG TPA: ParB/RepB/Spo0J family partition protein [Nitrososphaeraceae archaeon]
MASIGQYTSSVVGQIENINMSSLVPSAISLRVTQSAIEGLIQSIKDIGLLQPLVVRTKNDRFEIVAGNRRYHACKSLGYRRVSCHILELSDKEAYEVSVIENLQRHTLSPLEEGLAFRRYTYEMGWGGITELSRKISKSPSYISKRMRILDLPAEILELLSQNEIKVTIAEELLSVKNKDRQSHLASLINNKKISLRESRKIIHEESCSDGNYNNLFLDTELDTHAGSRIEEQEKYILGLFDKSIIALRIAYSKLGSIMTESEYVRDNWIYHDVLMHHRSLINSQIDLLIRQRRKTKRVLKWGG